VYIESIKIGNFRLRRASEDGSIKWFHEFSLPDHSVEGVVSTYVLDLLSEEDIRLTISEARRVLMPDGKLCLVSLTQGVIFVSRIVIALWSALFSLRPLLVESCRPILLNSFFDQAS
jgi:ubiquinone/menaquinone biosynthesis C-methylase UbiE